MQNRSAPSSTIITTVWALQWFSQHLQEWNCQDGRASCRESFKLHVTTINFEGVDWREPELRTQMYLSFHSIPPAKTGGGKQMQLIGCYFPSKTQRWTARMELRVAVWRFDLWSWTGPLQFDGMACAVLGQWAFQARETFEWHAIFLLLEQLTNLFHKVKEIYHLSIVSKADLGWTPMTYRHISPLHVGPCDVSF